MAHPTSVLCLRFVHQGITATHLEQEHPCEDVNQPPRSVVSRLQLLPGHLGQLRAGPSLATMLKPLADLLLSGVHVVSSK
jgi:hypothetical protein